MELTADIAPRALCERLGAAFHALDTLDDLREAPRMAAMLRDLQGDLPAAGFSGEAATQLISDLNDRLTAAVVKAVACRHRLPPTEWCWLAMGSEGRHEQTLVSDQDNGLIFAASGAAEAAAMRALFLPFCQDANRQLADCGFSLCTGEIMAGNPAWCLSLDEWRDRFISWVRCPEPAALLNATIFFDLRPLCGQRALGELLRDLLPRLTVDATAFQHLMAANALQVVPPLGFRGEVSVGGDATVDLKKLGSRIFVDVARILALAHGVRAVNTFDRLRLAGRAAGMLAPEIEAASAALSHILRLRLSHQAAQSGTEGITGLRPADLHEVDRSILKESLRQARRLQQRLKLNYAL